MDVVSCRQIVLVGIFGLILGRILTRQLVELPKGCTTGSQWRFGARDFIRGNDELSETAISEHQMFALEVYAGELETAKEVAEAGRDRAVCFTRWYSKPVPGRSDRG